MVIEAVNYTTHAVSLYIGETLFLEFIQEGSRSMLPKDLVKIKKNIDSVIMYVFF